ncbi:MAG: TIGR03663 family protein [Acidobacteria bacterium]|nr:TIGR03663 family protein [Acidobacteriota bacterium]
MIGTRGNPRREMASWERASWLFVLIAAASTRLWDLGLRAMSHDESLHAFFSFKLLSEGVYRHEPVYHGPLLYHLDALVFYLLGATDFSARLAPTLIGVLVVASLWLLRDYLGRRGALLAALLVTISPTLLFYSRHLRNDIYIAFFTLMWAYGAFRYLDGRQKRWWYLVTASMGLAFITKEVSFITGAVIGAFFAAVAVMPARGDATSRKRAAADLALLMLALVLPFASGAVFLAFGWSPVGTGAEAEALGRGALVLLALFGVAIVGGALRFGWGDWLTTMGLFWGLQLTFFTTFFTNVRAGLASGIVGSLGYWLTQHEVARGGQPWFYYGLIGLLYEFLPMLLGGVAASVGLWRLRQATWDPVDADDRLWSSEGPCRETRRLWLAFLIWWTAASWIGYAWAGERMPWLLVHQVLPLCLLAGWGARRLVAPLENDDARGARWLLVGGSALTVVTVVGVLRSSPFTGRGLQATTETAGWWVGVLVQAGLLGAMSNAVRRVSGHEGRRLVGLGVVLLGVVLTARASVRASFANIDRPTEPMSYAQASPDVKRILREIDAIDERSGGQHMLRVAIDDETMFPMSWYLRDYPNTVSWRADPSLAASAAVIVVGLRNRAAWPLVARGYSRRRGILLWWPLQEYSALSPSKLRAFLADPDERHYLWQVFMYRQYGIDERQWPGNREFDVYLRDDAAALVGISSAVDTDAAGLGRGRLDDTPWTPEAVLTGPFAGRPLSRPTGVAVARDGAWLVADGGNHRVVVIEPRGTVRVVIGGGRCALTEPGQPGCVDPDGAGPRAAGDGQFDEPWGVASGPNGEIVVADTGNGRIQVFDARGAFLRAWGRSGQVPPGTDDGAAPRFLEPKGLTFDAAGRLVVADAGNNRLLFYGTTGHRQGSWGPVIDVDPPLDGPASVALDANETLLVADHQRILRVDRFARTLAVWRVPEWDRLAAGDNPALAVDSTGLVYAVDPESGCVLVFSPAGALEARLLLPRAGDEDARPTGVAIDGAAGRLLVVDRAGNRLLVMPLFRPRS